MGRGPPAVVNGWGDTGTGPQEVQGGPRTGLLNRGNHERHGTHSVFTQLDGVYIPSGATQFTCSTTCRPYAVMRGTGVRTRRRPTEVVPGGRLTHFGGGSFRLWKPRKPPNPRFHAAPCQLEPHPPPPQDDEEPHEDEEPQEEEDPQEDPPPPSPPVHQLVFPLPDPPEPPDAYPLRNARTTPTAAITSPTHTTSPIRIQKTTVISPPPVLDRPDAGTPVAPRTGGMPSGIAAQSPLEQVQSFPAGWRP